MSTSPGGSVYKSPGFALRGTGRPMPHIVRRYTSIEEYLDPTHVGTPVSADMKTWEDAQRVRDCLREGESRYYYNITHNTGCSLREKKHGRDSANGDNGDNE